MNTEIKEHSRIGEIGNGPKGKQSFEDDTEKFTQNQMMTGKK